MHAVERNDLLNEAFCRQAKESDGLWRFMGEAEPWSNVVASRHASIYGAEPILGWYPYVCKVRVDWDNDGEVISTTYFLDQSAADYEVDAGDC